ncbi:MAG: efflux RND transporter permease subunit [Candidatus Krumholzibacteria bacterium]|nr:efflux RND transporter permease subunit [Candidatus Krumholzibacteria bacterium]
MGATEFAITRKRITFVALFLVLVSGILTYKGMPRAEDPGFTIRTALVMTYFAGASPERVELLVTDKLEKKIQEMPEVDAIRSQSKSGVSVVYVDIKENYTEMRPIWDDLRRKVDDARGQLPSGVIGPIVNDEFGDVFGTLVTLTAEGYTYAEMKQIADDARNELLLIPEVAKVDIHGAQEERVFVEFNNARLAELSISPAQLQNILENRNIVFPGGQIFTEDEQLVLEPSGNFESVEELKRTVISLPGRRELVYLGDVTEIRRSYIDPPNTKVTFNGQRALVLAVSMREGGNIITLGEDVKKQVTRFQQAYPIGVDFSFLYFQPDFVEKKVSDFARNLLQAVAIVIVVMLLFLGFRTGLVIASLIPMAMVMALLIMGFFRIGLDQMSLASLIIALGMLVDNAIVMSESIMVQMSEGKAPVSAAIDSAVELRIPLLTSSLTTAAAFLPIFLAESTVGEYTAPIFKVVTITLLSSWMLALTMTPLLCVLFLKVKKKTSEEAYDTRFYQKYRVFLLRLLRRPFVTVAVMIAIFVAALQLAPFIPAIFFPANDKPVMSIDLEMPIGTPLQKTEKIVHQLETFIGAELRAKYDSDGAVVRDGIVNWASFIGSGAPRFQLPYNPEPQSPEYAYLLLNVSDRWKMETNFIPELEAYCYANFPDLTATVSPLELGPPVEAPVQVRISGKDTDEIFLLVDNVKSYLAGVQGTKDIKDDWGARAKKLFVQIDQPRAQRAGLTSQDIAVSLQTVLSGIETTDYREDDEVIPVVLRSVAADRKDIGKLESHNIYVQATGRAVPLKQVADVHIAFEPSKIWRWGRLKTVTVSSNLQPGYNAIAIANQIDDWMQTESWAWPVGYKYELGGEIESSGDAQDSIMAKLPIAFLVIILLLVAQFDSIRRPLIILLTIPLGLIGIFVGLFITQMPLGFMAFLGVVALAGIVINNAIVLIDRIKIEIEEHGREPARAVVEAAQRRLRPILLTTMTTMGGLIPLWLGGGPMFESMAVAIVFGLLFATVLTLGWVPVLYSLFFRIRFKDFEY